MPEQINRYFVPGDLLFWLDEVWIVLGACTRNYYLGRNEFCLEILTSESDIRYPTVKFISELFEKGEVYRATDKK